MADFLPYGRQQIDEDDILAVQQALRAVLITQGPLVESFERALGAYVGANNVSVMANGTAALQLAYAALGLAPGEEIITSPITFAATANAARYLGAEVRFADIEPETGNIDPHTVEALITPQTRGIVAVHFGGLPADLKALRAIADQHKLWLVEDASHALGATYCGDPIGSCQYSDAATFSFHPVKHLTTGEGGAVAVRDSALKKRIDRLRQHGIERETQAFFYSSPGPWYYEMQELGWNYRLTDIQCALGLSQLAKQPAWVAQRRRLAAWYREAIAARFSTGVRVQAERDDAENAYHLLVCLVDFAAFAKTRAQVMHGLRARGIGSQVHYVPVSWQPYYRQRYGEPSQYQHVETFYEAELSLPMYPQLSQADVLRIVDALATELGV